MNGPVVRWELQNRVVFGRVAWYRQRGARLAVDLGLEVLYLPYQFPNRGLVLVLHGPELLVVPGIPFPYPFRVLPPLGS